MPDDQVLVCSTASSAGSADGKRRTRLCRPRGKLDSGAAALKTAAEPILTTDTRIKVAQGESTFRGGLRLTGFARGQP